MEGGFCVLPHKRGCHTALGRRKWAFRGASGLQDLTVKGILVSKWAWRSGVSVVLWIGGYLCSMGAMNLRPSDHLCLG